MEDSDGFKIKLDYLKFFILIFIFLFIWLGYDRRSDRWRHWNGQPRIVGGKVNGKDEGIWIWFYENGEKQMQGNFSKGKREGVWTLWDSLGRKISESIYAEDKLNGEFIRYYPNGNIQARGRYNNDTLVDIIYFIPNNDIK